MVVGPTDPSLCVYCLAPVVAASQRDAEGRPTHLSCQQGDAAQVSESRL